MKSVAILFKSNRALATALMHLSKSEPRGVCYIVDKRVHKDLAKAQRDLHSDGVVSDVIDVGEPACRVDIFKTVFRSAVPSEVVAAMSRIRPCDPEKRPGKATKTEVHLLTVHGSKGSEFDTVIVDGPVFKWKDRCVDDFDPVEFVGITRSKKCLVLTTALDLVNVDRVVKDNLLTLGAEIF